MEFPYLITDSKNINNAYRLAIATLAANILPYKDGVLEEDKPVIIAGLGYNMPWTRDASINTWNAAGLICPDVSLNTLKSVLIEKKNGYRIGGQYWDAIIWVIGAWYQYLYTGNKEFLKTAYSAALNSLSYFEETEFDENRNLFRGPACYGDGVAAYPDRYAKHGESDILNFAKAERELCYEKGVGIPMFALSTNCLYYYAYVLSDKMADELNKPRLFENKADKLSSAINKFFWSEEKQNYIYVLDDFGVCESQEGMGSSFAILFGIADKKKIEMILKAQHLTEHGIPCIWPNFERYSSEDGMSIGRHSGTVWPHIQGFFADAAARSGANNLFDREFLCQTENALRYNQFAEIYHPITGEIYGGMQECHKEIIEWRAEPFQTWSATAYLRNVYMDIIGMRFKPNGIYFAPVATQLINTCSLKGVHYRKAVLDIQISGCGSEISCFSLNGCKTSPFVPADITGKNQIEIVLS